MPDPSHCFCCSTDVEDVLLPPLLTSLLACVPALPDVEVWPVSPTTDVPTLLPPWLPVVDEESLPSFWLAPPLPCVPDPLVDGFVPVELTLLSPFCDKYGLNLTSRLLISSGLPSLSNTLLIVFSPTP